MQPSREFRPNKTKEIKVKLLGFPWICLVLFVRIRTFQRVTAGKIKKIRVRRGSRLRLRPLSFPSPPPARPPTALIRRLGNVALDSVFVKLFPGDARKFRNLCRAPEPVIVMASLDDRSIPSSFNASRASYGARRWQAQAVAMVAFDRAPAEITSPSMLPAADLTGFDPLRAFPICSERAETLRKLP
jgi:hypothetical protein